MMFSDEGLLAIKIVAATAPMAGFAAVAHVQARRRARRAHEIAAALSAPRSVTFEVAKSETQARGSVHFELTPHLCSCLSAAGSASLRGMRSPDAVMMAMEIEATWTSRGEAVIDDDRFQKTRLFATRELVVIRSTFPARESVEVPLRSLLEAHRATLEGEPLYCTADGEIQAAVTRTLRVSPQQARKEFYWVRADWSSDGERKAAGKK